MNKKKLSQYNKNNLQKPTSYITISGKRPKHLCADQEQDKNVYSHHFLPNTVLEI